MSACKPAPPLGSVAAKVRTIGGVSDIGKLLLINYDFDSNQLKAVLYDQNGILAILWLAGSSV
jgi:hypothetical protein